MFGYVIFLCWIFYLIVSAVKRFPHGITRLLFIYSVAFLVCVPYLVYTYHLTADISKVGSRGAKWGF